MKPLFIFSLPRSGSTLVQRVLAANDRIDTAAEPWLLLPLLYALKKEGAYAEYSHVGAVNALEDFVNVLPKGREDYFEVMRDMLLALYQKASVKGEVDYFLDKTPRYTLICDDIVRIFPNEKHVFLWRNPLAIAASMIETWGAGKWNLYHYKIDLYKGLANLIHCYKENCDKVFSLNYESFLQAPEKELMRLGRYLEVDLDENVLAAFSSISFSGRMGDTKGAREYKKLSQKPIGKWKETMCNPWRKWWCKKYLLWLGVTRLKMMGYDLQELLREVDEIPFSLHYLCSDLIRVFYGILYCWVSPTILKRKWQRISEWGRVVNHS